jgi:hypothetical protein
MKITKSILLEPMKIKSMELQNRFVRLVTYDVCADKNYVTEKQINLNTVLAERGVGLIKDLHPLTNELVIDLVLKKGYKKNAKIQLKTRKLAGRIGFCDASYAAGPSNKALYLQPSWFI